MKSSKNVANGIPRREFLRISSVAAIGVAVAFNSERKAFAAATDSGIVPLMSVGYAPSLPLAGYSVPLASADSILSPDPRFISSGAHISVVGSKRAASHANAPGGIGVDALFDISSRPSGDAAHYRFFSIAGRPDHDALSGLLSFTTKVAATSGVSFLVRRQRPSTSTVAATVAPALETEASPVTLSLGNVAGPKLTRGVYAFAFREEESDSMSNWGRLSIAPTEDGSYLISGATFSYMLLHVDYAEQAETAPDRRRASRH